jgi:hypothetical protein
VPIADEYREGTAVPTRHARRARASLAPVMTDR